MSNYCILYQTSNGAFIALADTYVDPPPVGYSLRAIGADKPDMDKFTWDPAGLRLVPKVPGRFLAKHVFIQRFTDAERRVLFGFSLDSSKTEAQRKLVAAFVWYLTFLDTINLDDPSVVSGVEYLETISILAAGRAAQILS